MTPLQAPARSPQRAARRAGLVLLAQHGRPERDVPDVVAGLAELRRRVRAASPSAYDGPPVRSGLLVALDEAGPGPRGSVTVPCRPSAVVV